MRPGTASHPNAAEKMAITEVAEYAHLSAADTEALAVELDAIRVEIENSRGAKDRRKFSDLAAPPGAAAASNRSVSRSGPATAIRAKCGGEMRRPDVASFTRGVRSVRWELSHVAPARLFAGEQRRVAKVMVEYEAGIGDRPSTGVGCEWTPMTPVPCQSD